MMSKCSRWAVLGAVVGALLLTTAARADLEVGAYAPDFEATDWLNSSKPVSLIELRGMIVVVVFWVSWFEGGEFVLPQVSAVQAREVRSRGYYVVGLTDSEKSKVEKLIKDKKIFFPVGTASKSAEEYKIKQYPALVVIDPLGKIAWSGSATKMSEAVKAIENVFRDNPPFKTHPDDVEAAHVQLARSRQSLREGDVREARKAAEEAIRYTVYGDPLRAQCQDVLDLIETLGRDKLARAQAAVDDKRFEDAVSLLREARQDYLGLEVARTAFKRMEGLKKRYSEVGKLLEREGESARAELALKSAIDALRAKQIGDAYVKFEDIIEQFAETEAASKSKTVIERINKNEGMMGYVRDHKAASVCEPWLVMAGNFARNKQNDKARDLYRRVLDEYGDTVWADEAARRLQLLP